MTCCATVGVVFIFFCSTTSCEACGLSALALATADSIFACTVLTGSGLAGAVLTGAALATTFFGSAVFCAVFFAGAALATVGFPSIPARHDLSRRVDANWIAGLVVRGIVDMEDAEEMIQDTAYRLAKKAYKLYGRAGRAASCESRAANESRELRAERRD